MSNSTITKKVMPLNYSSPGQKPQQVIKAGQPFGKVDSVFTKSK
jgi:hypothetical protein